MLKKLKEIKSSINNLPIWLGMGISIIIIAIYIICKKINNSKIFMVLLNLSFSYLAAVFFYITQVLIPMKTKKKVALKILQPDIYQISNELAFFCAFIDAIFEVNGEKVSIKGIDNDIIYFKYKLNGTDFQEYKNYKEYLVSFAKKLKNDIKTLRGREAYQYLDDDLHDIVTDLDIKNFSMISAIGTLYPSCRNYSNIENEIKDIIKLSNNIMFYAENKSKYEKMTILEQTEKEDYKKNIDQYKRSRLNV